MAAFRGRWNSFFSIFGISLWGLGKSSHVLGKRSTPELHPSPLNTFCSKENSYRIIALESLFVMENWTTDFNMQIAVNLQPWGFQRLSLPCISISASA